MMGAILHDGPRWGGRGDGDFRCGSDRHLLRTNLVVELVDFFSEVDFGCALVLSGVWRMVFG